VKLEKIFDRMLRPKKRRGENIKRYLRISETGKNSYDVHRFVCPDSRFADSRLFGGMVRILAPLL